jgi:glycosyltransferase involved in cell wall biosynthesis
MSGRPTVLSVMDLNPRKLGSMEEYAAQMSRALHQRGWRSVMAFIHPPPAGIAALFDGTDTAFEVFRRQPVSHLYSDLFGLCRKYRPEVVHIHFLEQFSLLALLPRLAGARLTVFTDHFRQPQPLSLATRISLRLWNFFVPGLARLRLIAISAHIRRTLVDCYGVGASTIATVLNGVNVSRFSGEPNTVRREIRSELGIALESAIVMTVAALIPQKGIDDFLQAAARILARRPDVAFVIVGDGPEDSALRAQADQLGIFSKVRFTGLRSDVHRLMPAADVIVVPSVWQEPAGLVVLEAMASARPVVATRVGGIPEYLEEGQTGVLVDPGMPQQIAEAVRHLLDSPETAATMGAAGRRRIQRLFTMERWAEETVKVYERGLKG